MKQLTAEQTDYIPEVSVDVTPEMREVVMALDEVDPAIYRDKLDGPSVVARLGKLSNERTVTLVGHSANRVLTTLAEAAKGQVWTSGLEKRTVDNSLRDKARVVLGLPENEEPVSVQTQPNIPVTRANINGFDPVTGLPQDSQPPAPKSEAFQEVRSEEDFKTDPSALDGFVLNSLKRIKGLAASVVHGKTGEIPVVSDYSVPNEALPSVAAIMAAQKHSTAVDKYPLYDGNTDPSVTSGEIRELIDAESAQSAQQRR